MLEKTKNQRTDLTLRISPRKLLLALILVSFILTWLGFLGDLLFYYRNRCFGLFLFKGDRKTGITVWFASMLFMFTALTAFSHLQKAQSSVKRGPWIILLVGLSGFSATALLLYALLREKAAFGESQQPPPKQVAF